MPALRSASGRGASAGAAELALAIGPCRDAGEGWAFTVRKGSRSEEQSWSRRERFSRRRP